MEGAGGLMKVTDVHIHGMGEEDPKGFLKAMDGAGIHSSIVFAPFPIGEDKQRERIDWVANFAKEDPERIIPFAWLEPFHDGCCDHLEYGVKEAGIRGLKMIPNHWYPYDDNAMKVYEKVQELGIPILFHSGILWGFEDSSRFCRPCFYEALLHTPRVKFALAHISWPWTDECLATAGRFRAAVGRAARDGVERPECQMFIDCTPGTPQFYREEALDRAFRYLGAERLMYGSDQRAGADAEGLASNLRSDRKFLTSHLGRSEEECERFFSGTFEVFMKPMK